MKSKKFKSLITALILSAVVSIGCVSCDNTDNSPKNPSPKMPPATTYDSSNYIPIVKMNLSSTGIKNGIIDAQYGAASKNKLGAMPLESIPLEWSGAPKTTKSYAITLIDYDTVPIMGFPWIHWIASDIPTNVTSLPANASTTMASSMVQGVTSYANGYPLQLNALKGFQVPREKAYHYGGMVPVNFPHKYTMTVYALDTTLNLKAGFGLNDLYNAIEGHVVGKGVVYGTYNASVTKL